MDAARAMAPRRLKTRAGGFLVAVIGDEDTATGFLLAGVGQNDATQGDNYFVVDSSKCCSAPLICSSTFLLCQRGIILVLLCVTPSSWCLVRAAPLP